MEALESATGHRGLQSGQKWSLLSRHGFVLFVLAINSNSTMRELSDRLGLSERTLYGIIRDLTAADMIHINKTGRNNTYSVNGDARFISPLFNHLRLGEFLDALKPPS